MTDLWTNLLDGVLIAAGVVGVVVAGRTLGSRAGPRFVLASLGLGLLSTAYLLDTALGIYFDFVGQGSAEPVYQGVAIGSFFALVLGFAFLTSEPRQKTDDTTVDSATLAKTQADLSRRSQELLQARSEPDTDLLTGLWNRRYLYQSLERECQRARRYENPLSCLMLRLDDFSLMTEVYGDAAGDEVLMEIATRIKSLAREADIVTLYREDLFCVLLPETAFDGAMQLAERIRSSIAAKAVEVWASHRVTVSVGVYSPTHKDDFGPAQIVSRAKAALREAEDAGKNRVSGHLSATTSVA
jgi:diguanylate cyclase (GGDEF)-like protein